MLHKYDPYKFEHLKGIIFTETREERQESSCKRRREAPSIRKYHLQILLFLKCIISFSVRIIIFRSGFLDWALKVTASSSG